MSYIGLPEWVEVQVENVLSKVLPAGVELGGDEPDTVRAETLVVDTELHSLTIIISPWYNTSPGRGQETENNSGHSKHCSLTDSHCELRKLLNNQSTTTHNR